MLILALKWGNRSAPDTNLLTGKFSNTTPAVPDIVSVPLIGGIDDLSP
jgi:hypothetical protein